MNVYSFDLCGRMAHFRKRYTNSSAMTNNLPPRSTIAGIIANQLGLKHGTYYDILSRENLDIAVACMVPPVKHKYRMKYLYITRDNKLQNNSALIPCEFLLPPPQENHLRYRVWVHPKESFPDFCRERLDNLFKGKYSRTYGSAVSLGPAFCLGWQENFETGTLKETAAGKASISSAIRTDIVKDLTINSENRIMKEDMTLQFHLYEKESFEYYCQTHNLNFSEACFDFHQTRLFVPKAKRLFAEDTATVFYDTAGRPIKAEVEEYAKVEMPSGLVNITWL